MADFVTNLALNPLGAIGSFFGARSQNKSPKRGKPKES